MWAADSWLIVTTWKLVCSLTNHSKYYIVKLRYNFDYFKKVIRTANRIVDAISYDRPNSFTAQVTGYFVFFPKLRMKK